MLLWNQNRSAGVVTGKILSLRDLWLEIWIISCRPHASSILHSIWSTPIITICWKATCRLLSLPPWASCSESGCSLNVTDCFPSTESRRQNQTSVLYILDGRRRDMWLWPHRYQKCPKFNVLLISPWIWLSLVSVVPTTNSNPRIPYHQHRQGNRENKCWVS